MSKISVIVPVYKTEQYLADCVDSILNQTYQNLEVILVDDGSPDSCPAICDRFAEKDSRVRVIHKTNGGLSSARNAGIAVASGDWIMFVDSDDVCEYEMISDLREAARVAKAPLAICSMYYLTGSTKRAIDTSRLNGRIQKSSSREVQKNLWKSEYDNNIFTAPCNKLFNRRFFENRLHFREGIIYEDDDLFNRLYLEEYPIAVINKALYCWRMNPTSITHQTFSDKNCIFLSILRDRVAMFEKIGLQQQVSKTAKVFCDIYIEYYYKAKDAGHSEWVGTYRNDYRRFQRICGWKGMVKNRIRFFVFDISSYAYRRFIYKQ